MAKGKRPRRIGWKRKPVRKKADPARQRKAAARWTKPTKFPFAYRELPTLLLVELFRLLAWVGLAGGIYLGVLGVMRVNGWESPYVPLSARRHGVADEGGSGDGSGQGEEFLELDCGLFALGDCILHLGSFLTPFERYLAVFGHELRLYVDHYGNYAILVIAGMLFLGSGLLAVGVAVVDNLRAIRRIQQQIAMESRSARE